MFYTEEDITPAVELARKIFGPENQYHTWSEGQIMMNVALLTPKFGKIWSGDLLLEKEAGASATALQKKLDLLADTIGQTVFLTDRDNPYIYVPIAKSK